MELILTDEQRLLSESAAKFFARDGGVKRARRLGGKDDGFDRDGVRRLAETGWLGMLVLEEWGGLQLGPRELALIMVEAGKVLAPEPTADLVLAALLLSAGDEASSDLLDPLLTGQAVIVPALEDASGGLDLTQPGVNATRRGAEWRLDGSKSFVLGANGCDGFVVSAADPDGLLLCHVPRNAPGLDVRTVSTVDDRPYGEIRFRDVPSRLILRGNAAAAALQRHQGLALVAAAAEMLGVMEGVTALTLDYLKTRKQFGRPIGSFQALQHRAVDNYVLIESTRSLLYQVCESGEPIAATMASALKAVSSAAALTVTKSAVQLHGAIGFTDEYDAGLYLKRAMWLSSHLGNAAAHQRRYASLSR